MNPFWEISYVFQDLRLHCRDIAQAIWTEAFVPNILGDWFWDAADWFQNIQEFFIDTGWWYEEVIDSFQEFVTFDWLDYIIDDIQEKLEEVWEWFSGWWDEVTDVVDEWWRDTRQDVIDWISQASDWLEEQIDDLGHIVNNIDAWIDNFIQDTLPDLLSFDWFSSWWGNVNVSFDDWWRSAWSDILENIDVALDPVQERIAQFDQWFDLLKDFIDDPEKWLLDKLESMLARFW